VSGHTNLRQVVFFSCQNDLPYCTTIGTPENRAFLAIFPVQMNSNAPLNRRKLISNGAMYIYFKIVK
jgi:hypothetical protein